MEKRSLLSLASNVHGVRAEWETARQAFERARADLDYAKRRVILAREDFDLEWERRLDPDSDFEFEIRAYPEGEIVNNSLRAVQYVGVPIRSALRKELERRESATPEDLVEALQGRGFEFTADVPVREVNAALMKQTWAKLNKSTGQWEFKPEPRRAGAPWITKG